jgi:hypothetical protein
MISSSSFITWLQFGETHGERTVLLRTFDKTAKNEEFGTGGGPKY